MPHKVEAMKYMDSLATEVKEIGSMNTVVVSGKVVEGGKERQKLEGRNTDVDGIKRALLASLPLEQQGKAKPFGEGRSAIISAYSFSSPLATLLLTLCRAYSRRRRNDPRSRLRPLDNGPLTSLAHQPRPEGDSRNHLHTLFRQIRPAGTRAGRTVDGGRGGESRVRSWSDPVV